MQKQFCGSYIDDSTGRTAAGSKEYLVLISLHTQKQYSICYTVLQHISCLLLTNQSELHVWTT